MDDLVDKVRSERGLLKKIEMAVPGFRGYRKKEDLRQSDQILRQYLARRLEAAMKDLEGARTQAGATADLVALKSIAAVIAKLRSFIADTRHAEAGYSGLGAAINILEPDLLRVYEMDVNLIEHVKHVEVGASKAGHDAGRAVDNALSSTRAHFDARANFLRGVA